MFIICLSLLPFGVVQAYEKEKDIQPIQKVNLLKKIGYGFSDKVPSTGCDGIWS